MAKTTGCTASLRESVSYCPTHTHIYVAAVEISMGESSSSSIWCRYLNRETSRLRTHMLVD